MISRKSGENPAVVSFVSRDILQKISLDIKKKASFEHRISPKTSLQGDLAKNHHVRVSKGKIFDQLGNESRKNIHELMSYLKLLPGKH